MVYAKGVSLYRSTPHSQIYISIVQYFIAVSYTLPYDMIILAASLDQHFLIPYS